ncbi:GNAT family N-acetyltransferase [Aeromicrobium tamlense]|uniref:RimJ/RimL family protein N-acetyltransferase n=1 Tax=Aeromicrobium tamlense TaxID=375541 RepID=A0ABX2SGT6_9ACTN|nr:GNAT family N-acetyltransferase [Aeromicrobium tamlense]NYI37045.1 RimJ/RimL family protein N-acetyltransferase [Aeromicrobium tamlense]
MPTLTTERLKLRPWTPADREPFAELNADPEVMEHFPSVLDRAASDALADRFETRMAHQGWGLWVVEAQGRFAGMAGLNPVPPEVRALLRGSPPVEVGWRFARWAWGHGWATEAAAAAVRHGFDMLGLREIVSFTAVGNLRSRAVMERLGMTHDEADDFDHPALPADSPLRHHVLYRLPR